MGKSLIIKNTTFRYPVIIKQKIQGSYFVKSYDTDSIAKVTTDINSLLSVSEVKPYNTKGLSIFKCNDVNINVNNYYYKEYKDTQSFYYGGAMTWYFKVPLYKTLIASSFDLSLLSNALNSARNIIIYNSSLTSIVKYKNFETSTNEDRIAELNDYIQGYEHILITQNMGTNNLSPTPKWELTFV